MVARTVFPMTTPFYWAEKRPDGYERETARGWS